jgi:cell division protein FtsB
MAPARKPARAAHRRPGATRRGARRDPGVARARLLLVGAIVVAAVIMVAWFPASSLLHQRTSLSGAQSQLATLHAQDAALAQEAKNLSDSTEIGRIAREQYQLVTPGQQAYEVLQPPGGSAAGTAEAGDPGATAPVTPSAMSELPPGGVTTTTAPHAAHATTAPGSPGLLSRMVHALEFWR